MSSKHYFSVAQANAMIPDLELAFGRMLQLRAQVGPIYQNLEALGFAPDEQEFELDPPGASPHVIEQRATLQALMQALRTDLEALQRRGCVVKDLEQGLVDWYALRDGEEIFLCWKLGEKSVDHWHSLHSGVAGRRPISEL